MIPCETCEVFFFTPEGRFEHDKVCIGYKPDEEFKIIRNEANIIKG